MRFITVVVALCFLAIEVRLFHLQVVEHPSVERRAQRTYRGLEDTLSARGRVLTRDGYALAESIPAIDVYADHRRTGDQRPQIAALLASHFAEVGLDEVSERLNLSGYRRVLRHPLADAEGIITLWRSKDAGALPGIDLQNTWIRRYPESRLAANVVGYVNAEGKGCAGLELSQHAYLEGTDGFRSFARDAAQRRIIDPHDVVVPPTTGYDVRLTIDVVLQYYAEEALEQVMAEHRPTWAACVAMDPRTGEILAMANRPTYDPNHYGAAPVETHRIPSVSFHYTPGSTFKPFFMACAVERAAVRPDELIDCSEFVYRGRSIGEVNELGALTPAEVIVKSSNRGMAKIALRLVPSESAPRDAQVGGFRRLRQTLCDLGFGAPTQVGLPAEAAGYLAPAANWSHAYTLASMAFGHEVAVTPLQLAAAFCVFANGGVYLEPYLIEAFEHRDGRREAGRTRSSRRVFMRRTADVVRDMLVSAVDAGTGNRAGLDGYSVAGKTSTAQWERDRSKYTASFAGFAPASDPRLLVVVVVDQPRGRSHFGGTVAAPAAQHVLEKGLAYLRVPRDRMVTSTR